MPKSTIFVFSLHKEAFEQVLSERDLVAEDSIRQGVAVRMIPGPRGFEVLIGPSEELERGIRCRVMSIAEELVVLRTDPGTPQREAWLVHLALEADSCSLH